MTRVSPRRTPRPAARTLAVLAAVSLGLDAHAGLVFRQVPTLPGATATALASDGTNVWTGTPRGVWKLSAGAWTPGGLAGLPILSLVSGSGVWAADGTRVWRRLPVCAPVPGGPCVDTWEAETLPGALTQPSALATDGSSLWAAGLGVAKKSGATWTPLANPGGKVLSAAIWSGDLVAGLRGNVARYTGASVSFLSTGLPATANVQTLASVGGMLWAGTDQTLYSWNGSAWVAEAGFGFHDVRAITSAGGALRVATADAGILKKSGSWEPDNAGILSPGALSFAAVGADLYAGTAGAPIYRLAGSSWSEAGSGLWAATISDVATVAGATLAAARGAGLGPVTGLSGAASAVGCGDVRALAGVGGDGGPAPAPIALFLAASNCNVSAFSIANGAITSATPAVSGLPAGVLPTVLARLADGTVAGGTPSAGMWRYVGSSWTSDNVGLSGTESILTAREVGGSLFTSSGSAFFVRRASGWQNATGAPSLVQALGGDSLTLFAAPATGIAAATLGGPLPAAWRADDFGANTAFVSSLDAGHGMAVAAGGAAGILRKKEGGWQPENAGLPPGVDARVARVLEPATGAQIYAGTAGNGLFAADLRASSKVIPVVLDVTGATGSRFRSDLTLGNRSDQPFTATFQFFGAPAFPGSGTATAGVTLPPHSEFRVADVVQYLRDQGARISSPGAGALVLWGGGPLPAPDGATDALYALSRTYTEDASGSYGVHLDGPSDLDAAEDFGAVYGLRSVAGVSRSNLALAYVPATRSGSDPITLSVQVYDQSGAATGAPIPVTLALGEWTQLNGILLQAGMSEPAYGYAKITRTSGAAAWTAYGVVNDAKTSDGSILPLYRPGGLAAARRLVVPVVLDVFGAAGSHYTTELTLANDGAFATPVDLFYQPALGSSTGVPFVTLNLAAGQQKTIADVIAFLRESGLNVPDAATGPQAGTLTVEFRNLFHLDAPRTVAIARTTTPNPNASTGGAFGVAYPAAAKGGGARASALVPGLTRDAAVRSNLAVVHLGGGSESLLSLSVRLYDAGTGQPVGIPVSVSLLPGDWTQWSGIFETAGVPANVTQAYAVVSRVGGDDTWLAYGVLNDQKTSDGSYVKMIPASEY